MSYIFQAKPTLHSVEDIPGLPKKRPWLISDLDGTLTKGGSSKLLMEKFVEKVEIGDPSVRQELLGLFDTWHKGSLKYETYLLTIGNKWSEMLYRAKETRANVMQVAENWYTRGGGRNLLAPYAAPMMKESERFRFNRLMLTGCPGEIAHPIAGDAGIEHVIAMMAHVDSDGRYCDTEIPREMNTGIRTIKSDMCVALNEEHALGLGLGDTLSDSGIARPVIIKNANNPDDIEGRFLLMNPREEVLERMRTAHDEDFNNGKIIVIGTDTKFHETMRLFRNTIQAVFEDNNKEAMFYEILGLKHMSLEEAAKKKAWRDEMENEWEVAA